MNEPFFIEVNCQQKSHGEARVCGDVFISRRVREEGRIIVVLSDGMGHGIKANLLGILTATLSVNLTQEHKSVQQLAEVIMKTLPYDSVKHMNFSTFTIVEIDIEGEVRILEYENPKTIIMRGNHLFEPEWNCVILGKDKNQRREVLSATFRPQKEDRIIFCSDGVSQSGMGSDLYPFGWERDNIAYYAGSLVSGESSTSAMTLAGKIVTMAHKNDSYKARDDISCAVIYFREPRKLLICTGPPYEKEKDKELANRIEGYNGKVILSGEIGRAHV